ncbi:MAG: hypothetical protein FK734_17580 [Asgard group archaeon]|nr:hypothetical protein [Asgard group archaeon]
MTFNEGERVFAYHPWREDWYIATIAKKKLGGLRYAINYNVPEVTDLTVWSWQVKPFKLEVGQKVLARYQKGTTYYDAIITAIKDKEVEVKYDDGGKKEWLSLKYIMLDKLHKN